MCGRSRRPQAFTLIELMIVVAIIGILAAIAIPNFLRFQRKAKRSEVVSNLKALFVSEKSYYMTNDTYVNSMEKIGFLAERGNRYGYRLTGGCSKIVHRTSATETFDSDYRCIEVDTFKYPLPDSGAALPPCQFNAAVTTGNTGSFMACAAGNLDNDNSDYDQWSISSVSRADGATTTLTTCTNGNNPAGEPCLDNSDI